MSFISKNIYKEIEITFISKIIYKEIEITLLIIIL